MNYKNVEIKMEQIGGKNINISTDTNILINPLEISTIHAFKNTEIVSICDSFIFLIEMHFDIILTAYEKNTIHEIVTGDLERKRNIKPDVEDWYNEIIRKGEEGDPKLQRLISAVKTLI
ncbi:hypothetical protein ACWGKR_24320 [Bacillus thuringiensis]|uniref:hypothetical protein n=1 Tax=Bacillus thuringiensis TaxID=1428 RepID=UPI0021D675C6|nr:hypothetical protein [Bacillus thuringiensis]MCU7679323.1 hypothetical protein [Bacillus thuringiensis]